MIIYPNFSPCDFTLKIDVYDDNGLKIIDFPEFININHNAEIDGINNSLNGLTREKDLSK